MDKVKNYKLTLPLTPVQLIWLHSHHHFMKVEEETKVGDNQIKFYKVNAGVEIRFESVGEQPDYSVAERAKAEIEQIVAANEIKLLDVSLVREVYVKVGKEARKHFGNSYIIFLHYETFENCSRKLKEKFGVTSALQEFDRLKQQNLHFCFLICEKSTFAAVFNFTYKLLNMEISCASTSISNKRDRGSIDHDTISLSKRAHSVTSLRGSFTSGDMDTHTQPQQRLSINTSQAGQEICEIGQTVIHNLDKCKLQEIIKTKIYGGSHIEVQYFQGSYLDIKKRLYYANRLQMFPNPYIQQVFSYGVGQSLNSWWVYFIVQKCKTNLKNEIRKTTWHYPRKKVLLVMLICKAVSFLHDNRQTHGQIVPQNFRFDPQGRLILCGTPNKNIPPHTNPFDYDMTMLLAVIYWIGYEAISKKLNNGDCLFTMCNRTRHHVLLALYTATNQLTQGKIDLVGYIQELQRVLDQS